MVALLHSRLTGRVLSRACALAVLSVTGCASTSLAAHRAAAIATTTTTTSGLTFDGNFDSGSYKPFTAVQCANTGTPSKPPRYRGTIALDSSIVGQGRASARITAPKTPRGYPLTACNLNTPLKPLGLGSDGYYGLMFYEPAGWTIPNRVFFGINIEQFHFQNIYGAPITFQLHPDHVTVALQTGACANHTTSRPGCAYHSNADNPNGNPGNVPAEYAIPRGRLVLGQWNEIVMHVHWASDGTGQIQTSYRVKGASAWNAGSAISGIPTVQWDQTRGCCAANALQQTELYTGAVSAPVSVWLDNDVESEGAGSSLAAVQAAMP